MSESIAANRRFKAPERKSQILAAARSLFAKQGYHSTTLDNIASKVGVTRARVLQLCGSKEELYRSIVEEAYKDHPLDRDLQDSMDRGDDLGVLRNFAEHILEAYAQPADREILTILMYSRLRDDEFSKEHFKKKDALMIRRLTYWLSSRIAQGSFKRVDPQVTVTAYQAMVMNLAVYKQVLGQLDYVSNQELALNCAGLFLNGLTADHPSQTDERPRDGQPLQP
jgi:AcrR family transcriptional regulator